VAWHGQGHTESLIAATLKHDLIRREHNGRPVVSSWEVLKEEQRMLDFAVSGRGACKPLASGSFSPDPVDELTAEQEAAVRHVVHSTDRVTLIRGGAGTGKTHMMRAAAKAIREGGHEVFAFAPSAGASRGVLRTEGFPDAETVARLLVDTDLQEQARGQVIWIDEAGLLSSRGTARVFDLAKELNARIVLSGDKRQHSSVERGGTLRLLEEEAGLIPPSSGTSAARMARTDWQFRNSWMGT